MRQLPAIPNNEVPSPEGVSQAYFSAEATSYAPGLGAGALWNARMARPVTDRTASMGKLDTPLPADYQSAIQHLVDARNEQGGANHKRLYARDLNEEALAELIQRVEAGELIVFRATPASKASRKTLWVDEKLKAGVDHLAVQHGVTRSAVVWTALHSYLERRDALRGAMAA